MKHALKEKIKCKLVKLPSYMTNSLCKCDTISIEGLKITVDEIDTILLLRIKMIANRLGMKANFAAKLHTNRQR